jgi:hypothetical protein
MDVVLTIHLNQLEIFTGVAIDIDEFFVQFLGFG